MNQYDTQNPAGENGYGARINFPPPPAYYRLDPSPWYKPIRRNANIVCIGLILVILLGFLMPPLFISFFRLYSGGFDFDIQSSPEILSFFDMLGELFISVVMLAVPLAFMKLCIGIPAKVAFPMRRPRASLTIPAIFICLGVSVLGVYIFSVIAAFLENMFGLTPVLSNLPDPVGAAAWIVYFIRLAIVPAVFEELIFRGVIMQSLRRFGDGFALVSSSILFSLAHHNLVQGPNALLVGLVIGFFVLGTGSIRTGIIIHFINNALVTFIRLVTANADVLESGVAALLMLAVYAVSGLICFVYLLVKHNGIFHLAPSKYPLPEKKKYSLFFLTAAPVIYIAGVIFLTCLQFE